MAMNLEKEGKMSPAANMQLLSLYGQRKYLRRIRDGVYTQCTGRGSCSGQEKWQRNELAQNKLEENVKRKDNGVQ